jgi:hypothetical protein
MLVALLNLLLGVLTSRKCSIKTSSRVYPNAKAIRYLERMITAAKENRLIEVHHCEDCYHFNIRGSFIEGKGACSFCGRAKDCKGYCDEWADKEAELNKNIMDYAKRRN